MLKPSAIQTQLKQVPRMIREVQIDFGLACVCVCLPRRSLTTSETTSKHIFFFLPSTTVQELCREVSFEPLAFFCETQVSSLLVWGFQMFALFFTALPQTNIFILSPGKVYDSIGLGESEFTVCWMHCILPKLILRHANFSPALLSWRSKDFGKCWLKEIAVVSITSSLLFCLYSSPHKAITLTYHFSLAVT